MKNRHVVFVAILLFATLFHIENICAQTTHTTHAHSTSRHWKGMDVNTLLENPTYDLQNDGEKFYLYNVGTGRFVIEGGDWGMEGRLFFEDFGRPMFLYENSTIHPLITENTNANLTVFVCNVPGVTKGKSWTDYTKYAFTTVMDGDIGNGVWTFERIPNETGDTYTYYMYTNPRGSNNNTKKFYLGSAYGEWDPTGQIPAGESKGSGYYVHLDDDRTCWTTAGQGNSETHPTENDTKVLVNGDMVSIKELYQWRLIPADEFLTVLNEEVVGLNPSISSLVPDRDFTRNSDDFLDWKIDHSYNQHEHTAQSEGPRYGYTWGLYYPSYESTNMANQQGSYFSEEPWDAPVMLKKIFQQIKNSKYGYMSFEGAGSAYVLFDVPLAGWYQIEANAIYFSENSGHNAYLYALTQSGLENIDNLGHNTIGAISARLGYQEIPIQRLASVESLVGKYDNVSFPTSNRYKRTEELNLAVGKVLMLHGEDFRHKFWIYLNPTEYSDGYTSISFGIKKEDVTKTTDTKWKKDGVTYYYDTEWVCLDDIKISYMGLAPAFFYENEESLDYLVFDESLVNIDGLITDRPSAVPDNIYSGAVSLERTLKKNQWNSFSFPIPLTGEQIRLAFGEDAQLLELNSIGGMSHNSNVIDFMSVDLKMAVIDPYNVTPVVEPGKMYLLKPTGDPVTGADPFGRVTEYYQLGRNFFTVNTHINDGKEEGDADYYTHTILDTSTPYASMALASWKKTIDNLTGEETGELTVNGDNDGVSYVSYIRTPGYTMSVSDFVTTGKEGLYAPNGSYVLSGGKIYEINKDTPLKGFRGWITLAHRLFEGTTPIANAIRMSIDGVIDGEGITGVDATTIVPEQLSDDTAVYDLMGRKVGVLGDKLNKGIYIVRGKKFFVK